MQGIGFSAYLFYEALFGLFIGFFLSSILQNVIPKTFIRKHMKNNFLGIIFSVILGIVSSSCSYGAAELSKGMYKEGVDVRNIFSFLISSTNMNIAILILFAYLISFKFAFAEFFGGIIIIVFVILGFSIFERSKKSQYKEKDITIIDTCKICGMKGNDNINYAYNDIKYLFCSPVHKDMFIQNPIKYIGDDISDIKTINGWKDISQTFISDVLMLKWELLSGFLIAGFAESFIPSSFFANALFFLNNIPVIGYILLLLSGLFIAFITFVCSMGNVPVARYLNISKIPIAANITYIYGDLLILPLISIYRKSYPKRIIFLFLLFFMIGAMVAGFIMQSVFPYLPSFRLTFSFNFVFDILNIIAVVITLFLISINKLVKV
ncbi:permease [Patescibacteria group bacterium]|nr:permease [Patescibacteria group bacterium]